MSTITLTNSYIVSPANATIEPANLSTRLKITIVLRRNACLKNYADQVINGKAKILTFDEFNDMFAPSQEDINLVTEFAISNKLAVHKIYTNSATIKLVGSVENFNNAFGITLLNVTNNDRSYLSYSGSITLPSTLQDVVIGVVGLDDSLLLSHSVVATDIVATGHVPNTPQQVAQAYQFPNGTGNGTCIGIIELGGGYTQQNLTSTFSRVGLPVPAITSVSIAPGHNNPSDIANSPEVMMDLYVAGGVAPNAKLAVYFAVNSFAGFINAVNAAVHDAVNAPSVISISWGSYEQNWGNNASLMDVTFLQAIALGITVTAATGDYGSKAGPGYTNPYTVQYPASSPYVLSCGGTSMALNSAGGIASEVVWNIGTNGSSGGVSALYSVPAYQSGLTYTTYPAGTTSALSGRGIPDVSGQAVGYQFYYGVNNQPYPNASGTSAAAPLYAGLVAIVNQLTNRRVGFLNTKLYNNSMSFNDVTSGNNACPASVGYSATVGWDACTGLGSIKGLVFFTLLNQGLIYPYYNNGSRGTSGQVYPSPQL